MAYNMKGFSGFKDSPLRQDKTKTLRGSKTKEEGKFKDSPDSWKHKAKYTKSGRLRKEKHVTRDKFGRVVDREIIKYDKEGKIRKLIRARGPGHEEGRTPPVTVTGSGGGGRGEAIAFHRYPRIITDIQKDVGKMFPELKE